MGENIGTITQVMGPVVDVEFEQGNLPTIYTALTISNPSISDEEGNLVALRDVDCTAGVAGALVGALNGAETFPSDWVADTLEANKAVYGIDLEANARRLYGAVYVTS